MRIVLATWNVHAWVGSDEARDPTRSFDVIRRFEADVVALQEVEGSDWRESAEDAGFRHLVEPLGSRPFGNALLSREPLERIRKLDLSDSGVEPRGALDAIVSHPGGRIRVVATHFGLRAAERRRQAARLARHLVEEHEDVPLVLLGDFNDWTPWGGQLRPLGRVVGPFSRIPTFPSRRPVFALDRAAWRAPELTAQLTSPRDPNVRQASDHLPLRLALDARDPEAWPRAPGDRSGAPSKALPRRTRREDPESEGSA